MKLHCEQLGRYFPLQPGSNVIGRNPDCEIVIGSHATAVSRKHAECRLENARVMLRDLNSRNGTQLGLESLVPNQWMSIQLNDCFQICDYQFRLVDDRLPPGRVVIAEKQPSGIEDSSSIGLAQQALGSRTEPRRHNQLHALIRVTNALRGILETSEVLEEAAKILLDVFPVVERAVIGTVDDDGTISPRWWHQRHADSSDEIRISKTIVDQVVSTGQAILSNDLPEQFVGVESVLALAIHGLLCAPLFGEGEQIIGFVYVDTRGLDRFDQTDLEILAAVAVQISLALGYSRLHESVVHDRLLLYDLEQARVVQERYLPTASPNIPGYEVGFFYRAARHVGGDYLDSLPLAPGKHLFVLGDVEGKGAPAALTMVQLATETRAGTELASTPADLLTRLNTRMHEKWVTFAAVHLDHTCHRLQLSNAGHELPLLRKAAGTVLELTQESRGLPLTVADEEIYQQDELEMEAGDMLVLYSDGFSDAQSEAGVRFGKERVLAALRELDDPTCDFAAGLCQTIDVFRGQADQFDDMCMICIRRVE